MLGCGGDKMSHHEPNGMSDVGGGDGQINCALRSGLQQVDQRSCRELRREPITHRSVCGTVEKVKKMKVNDWGIRTWDLMIVEDEVRAGWEGGL